MRWFPKRLLLNRSKYREEWKVGRRDDEFRTIPSNRIFSKSEETSEAVTFFDFGSGHLVPRNIEMILYLPPFDIDWTTFG